MEINNLVSISEKTCVTGVPEGYRRDERIVIHGGFLWKIGTFHNEEQLKQALTLMEIDLVETGEQNYNPYSGKIKFYQLSKHLRNSSYYFWTIEQLNEVSNGLRLKKVKGLSNGSIVDCYVGIGDSEVVIFRPNPNAKEVMNKMEHLDEIKFKKENWYL